MIKHGYELQEVNYNELKINNNRCGSCVHYIIPYENVDAERECKIMDWWYNLTKVYGTCDKYKRKLK